MTKLRNRLFNLFLGSLLASDQARINTLSDIQVCAFNDDVDTTNNNRNHLHYIYDGQCTVFFYIYIIYDDYIYISWYIYQKIYMYILNLDNSSVK